MTKRWTAEQWQSGARRAAQGLPTLATVGLVVGVAWSLAGLTWTLMAGRPSPELIASTPQPASTATSPGAGRRDFEALAGLDLFGQPPERTRPARPVVADSAPETELDLVLHGVYTGDDPAAGAAIIEIGGGEQRLFRTGDTLPGGAELIEVHSDRVVLSRNGRYESLSFPRPSAARAGDHDAGVKTTSEAPASLGALRERLRQQPQEVFQHVRVLPVRGQSGLKGYRLIPRGDRQLYQRLGLRPADIVTAVNGISVTQSSNYPQLMNQLMQADRLALGVLRRGRQQTITVELN